LADQKLERGGEHLRSPPIKLELPLEGPDALMGTPDAASVLRLWFRDCHNSASGDDAALPFA
jgi:hypothetical protein